MTSKEKTIDHKLSILIGVDSLSFIEVDSEGNIQSHGTSAADIQTNNVAVGETQLRQILEDNLLMEKDRVHTINLDGPHFSLVPSQLFQPGDLAPYCSDVDIDRDDLTWSDAGSQVCIYKYPLHLRSILSKIYPNATVKHLAESIYLYLKDKQDSESTIYLIQRDHRLYVVAFQHGQLKKFTHYVIGDWRDVMYFYTLANQVIDWEGTPRVRVNGDRMLVKELHPQLQKRVEDLDVIEWTNGWRLPESVSDPMQLFDLYCMHHAHHIRRV